MTTLPMDCQAALERLDAYRRGELSPEEAVGLRAHLDRCRKCLCIEQHERALVERLRAAGNGCCCPEKLRERIVKQCTQGCDDE